MNETPCFLDMENILAIHHRMINEFGGVEGVRDPGLLESAVMMPAARFSGKYLHKSIRQSYNLQLHET